MKLRFKKYIYLANDLTNLLLNKDREEFDRKYKNFRIFFLITLGLFIISLTINLYLILK